MRQLCGVFLLLCMGSLHAEGYYYKDDFIRLYEPRVLDENTLEYTREDGSLLRINNRIILKTLHDYPADYFQITYGLKRLKAYGRVLVLEVEDVRQVLALCQKIYEQESVLYVQPSFIKKITTHAIRFGRLPQARRTLKPRIIAHANEDTKSMLDSVNSVNYWKYYDDVFRFEDESFWHMHNKGGFITQAFDQGKFYDVLSQEDVDANILQVIDRGITGKGVRVAIIDSAFELTHPDLRFSDSYNFYFKNKDVTPNSTADFHGTAVAGVLGANRGNNYGIMGVAPDAYMIALNGLFDIEDNVTFSQTYLDIFYQALEMKASIINASWSTLDLLDEASEDAINTFITEARDGKGGFVVFSSGNEGSTTLSNESALDKVISVGSIEVDGSRSPFSNYGPRLDLVAPTNIVSLDLLGGNGFEDNEMGFVSGTSFSAPIVSGVIALMLEANPELTEDDVLTILYSTAKQVGSGVYANDTAHYEYKYDLDNSSSYNALYPKSIQVGYGLVDAEAAVNKAIQYKKIQIQAHNNPPPQHLFDNLKPGWNFLGTSTKIVDFGVFDQIAIVWILLDGEWKGYSPHLEYARELRRQNKLLTEVPAGSGLWLYQDAG